MKIHKGMHMFSSMVLMGALAAPLAAGAGPRPRTHRTAMIAQKISASMTATTRTITTGIQTKTAIIGNGIRSRTGTRDIANTAD